MRYCILFACIAAGGCATAVPPEGRVGTRFLVDTPPPPCVQTPRADTALVAVALVEPKPALRAGRIVDYDRRLLAPGEIATVLLEFVVNAEGSVDTTSIRAVEATNAALVPTAMRSLRHLEFWPGCVRAEAVRTRVAQRFRYAQMEESWSPRQPPPLIVPSARP